jgi:hypothetical protein
MRSLSLPCTCQYPCVSEKRSAVHSDILRAIAALGSHNLVKILLFFISGARRCDRLLCITEVLVSDINLETRYPKVFRGFLSPFRKMAICGLP